MASNTTTLWWMSRPSVRRVLLVVCTLLLLTIGFRAADGSVVASENDRDTRQHRALRRAPDGDAVAEDRTNAIDQPLEDPLQLKYYDVVAVDLVQSLSEPGGGSLVAAGAGEGKQAAPAATGMPAAKSESAKTLADQVAEGKYGLIHRELFQRRPQRLGVLNYRRNEEVPLDDERNYGGLRPDEIWLAEDHLLVLKGGSISFGSNRSAGAGSATSGGDAAGPWQPIDDYRAPERQVQIPANPAVPPPFPVQLREDGPIEFIRGDQVPAFNPFTNESAFLFTNKAFPVIRPEDLGGQNILARPAALNATGQHHNGLQYPPPVNPPPLSDNRTYSNPFLKLPPPGPPLGPPLGPRPPLGSLDDVPDNRTGGGLPPFGAPPADEDDPSLYYPPPYTFEYRGNYTNPVPPGPLVPGIILPPPPNFFILKPANGSEPRRGNATKAMKPTKAVHLHRPATSKATTTTPAPVATIPPPSANSVSKVVPSRVEIQKAVLKTFVPVLEVYGGSAKGGATSTTASTTTTTSSTVTVASGKRQRVKPTAGPSNGAGTHATPTPLLTPSTKLHKIPPEAVAARPARPSAPPSASQPIYAEYFNIKTSTVGPAGAVWSGDSVAPSPPPPAPPQLPRTYLPVAAVVGKGGRGGSQVPPARHPNTEFLSTTYGYSPIEQFHREVQTIRQTLQLYEKANKLTKAGRTSKAHPAPIGNVPLQYHEPSAPALANLSLAFGNNAVYRTLFPEEVVPPGGGAYKDYGGAHAQPAFAPSPYEPSPTYVYRQPAGSVQELPQSYYVTTGEGGPYPASFGRHAYSQQTPQYGHHDIPVQQQHQQQQQQQQQLHQQLQQQQQQQQQHFHHHHQQQQHQAYYQPQHQALPKYPSLPPPQPELSYIAPVILNNGASGYNRRPEFDSGLATTNSAGSTSTSTSTTTTKSYLILDHRHVQGTPTHRLRPDRQRQALADLPYFYRSAAIGYEHGEAQAAGVAGEQPVPGQRNRYLESDILVNYKHPLPVLNPDSEFLPYHHRLKVRKRQNVRGAGEHKPRQYFGQPLYNHR